MPWRATAHPRAARRRHPRQCSAASAPLALIATLASLPTGRAAGAGDGRARDSDWWATSSPTATTAAAPSPPHGLTVTLYNNTARAGPGRVHVVGDTAFRFPDDGIFSANVTGAVAFERSGWWNVTCEAVGIDWGVVWLDGHVVCSVGCVHTLRPGDSDNPVRVNASRTPVLPLRAQVYRNSVTEIKTPTAGTSAPTRLVVRIGRGDDPPRVASGTQLYRDLPPAERIRERLQTSLQSGWGLWNYHTVLDVVKLPEAASLSLWLCHNRTDAPHHLCICETKIEPGHGADVRVGPHAHDRSYLQLYYGNGSGVDANVSVEITAPSGGDELTLVATPISCGSARGCADYYLVLVTRYAWTRVGTAAVSSDAITFGPHGLPPVNLHVDPAGVPIDSQLNIPLTQPIAVSTTRRSFAESRAIVDAARDAHEAGMRARFADGRTREIATAIEAAVMWNLVYTPYEYGPFVPVSRSWGRMHPPTSGNVDFEYVLYEWDTFFAGVMMALFNRDLAYSTVIQVVKAKTAAGFIPNGEALGWKSEDRSEPPVGATVVLKIYERYGDVWFLNLVFNDLLDWNDWYWTRRRGRGGIDLMCLGDANEVAVRQHPQRGGGSDNMQGGRWESGMDNSPMYDGEFYNTTSHRMELYDVGLSSLFAADAAALADIAGILNKTAERGVLEARAERVRGAIAAYLWDAAGGVFTNRFTNMTFHRRVSPTSFYPLLAGAASDVQVDRMVDEWLLSPSRFCVSPGAAFAGNTDACYWGLPSISADDPAFSALGYWRGYVWGPLVQLTYWGLQRQTTPRARRARRALARQLSTLFLDHWRRHRHVCENYSPRRGEDACTGTQFYHWGALLGLVAVEEAGLWHAP